MKVKTSKQNLLFTALVVAFSVAGFAWLIQQPFKEQFFWLAQTHLLLMFMMLVLIKIIGLVWPPLPGGIFTITAIPFIGWPLAYLSDLVGTIIGAALCYAIARKWGNSLLSRLFDEATVKKINTVSVKTTKQVEFSFVMTISSRLVLTEVSYYAAGLLKVNFWKFLLGAVASHILIGLPSYYFAGILFKANKIYIAVIGWLVIVPIWLKLKGRYFEKSDV